MFGRTSISFLDDGFFNYNPALSTATPLDFFLPHSGFAKAWPLNATLIWGIARLGLNSISTVKVLTLLIHIANAFLVRELLRKQTSKYPDIFAAIYLLHPAMFLSLSWAWQIGTLLSLTLLLLALNLFRQNTLKTDIFAAFVYLLSILLKPWTVLFLPFFFFVTAYRVRRRERPLAIFLALSALIAIFVFKAWQAQSFAAERFPFEQSAIMDYKTGTGGLHQDPAHPIPFDVIHERMNSIPPTLTFLQTALDVSSSASRYTVMASGIKEPIIEPRSPRFRGTNALGFAVIMGFLTMGVLAIIRLSKPDERWNSERWLFALAVCFSAWLPHSGITYIPHFKFSFASPHYFALMLPGMILCLDTIANEINSKKWLPRGLIALACLFAARQTQLYWDLNHDIDAQTKACPVLVSPWRDCEMSATLGE